MNIAIPLMRNFHHRCQQQQQRWQQQQQPQFALNLFFSVKLGYTQLIHFAIHSILGNILNFLCSLFLHHWQTAASKSHKFHDEVNNESSYLCNIAYYIALNNWSHGTRNPCRESRQKSVHHDFHVKIVWSGRGRDRLLTFLCVHNITVRSMLCTVYTQHQVYARRILKINLYFYQVYSAIHKQHCWCLLYVYCDTKRNLFHLFTLLFHNTHGKWELFFTFILSLSNIRM